MATSIENNPFLDQFADLSSLPGFQPQGLCHFDKDHRIVVMNRQFQTLYGLPESLLKPGTHRDEVISAIEDATLRDLLTDVTSNPCGFGSTNRVWQTEQGRLIAVSCELLPDGSYTTLHEDITTSNQENAKYARLATHDPLTGLLNRQAFDDELQRVLSQNESMKEHALLYIDLDRFKIVNDTLGHPIGDQALIAITERIRNVIRSEDKLARLGGDEFALLQVEAQQPDASRSAARRIIDTVAQPLSISGHSVNLGASVGIAIAPFDADNAELLLQNADLALYRAKHDGRNTLRYFEPEMSRRLVLRRKLECELRSAIEAGQFEMLYQPVMNLNSQTIECVEGLVRWQHPELGLVSPDDFIPLAEETGLINPLGEWVLRQVCREAAEWDEGIRVAVNVSPVQLRCRMFASTVQNILQETGLDPSRLEVEITETALVADIELTIAILTELRQFGVKVAMDDFGTGYSSISYLRRFPFDKIKIDRSFVSGVDADPEAAALIKMIAALGVSLAVSTTAEGVETDSELDLVRQAGCTHIQGYHLSKPVNAGAIVALLESNKDDKTYLGE